MTHLRRFCLAASLTTAVIARPAFAEIEFDIVSVDNTAVLSGYETSDLQVTTDIDWTAGALLLELTSGSIYQNAYGGNFPITNPGLLALVPELEFDTSVSTPDGAIAGEAGDVGGDVFAFSTSELDVSFYNNNDSDTGTFSVGRITLTDDAEGTWSLGLTEDIYGQAMYRYSGTIAGGVMELQFSSQYNGMLRHDIYLIEFKQYLTAMGIPFDNDGVPLPPSKPWSWKLGQETPADYSVGIFPEPNTLAFFGLGVALCVRRRRR